jgi:hypothetical protein
MNSSKSGLTPRKGKGGCLNPSDFGLYAPLRAVRAAA